jgi:hypothetical protein
MQSEAGTKRVPIVRAPGSRRRSSRKTITVTDRQDRAASRSRLDRQDRRGLRAWPRRGAGAQLSKQAGWTSAPGGWRDGSRSRCSSRRCSWIPVIVIEESEPSLRRRSSLRRAALDARASRCDWPSPEVHPVSPFGLGASAPPSLQQGPDERRGQELRLSPARARGSRDHVQRPVPVHLSVKPRE